MPGMKTPALPDPRQVLLTPDQARAMLQLGETRLWQLIHSNELPAIRFSEKVYRIRAGVLEDWARKQEARQAHPDPEIPVRPERLRAVPPRKARGTKTGTR